MNENINEIVNISTATAYLFFLGDGFYAECKRILPKKDTYELIYLPQQMAFSTYMNLKKEADETQAGGYIKKEFLKEEVKIINPDPARMSILIFTNADGTPGEIFTKDKEYIDMIKHLKKRLQEKDIQLISKEADIRQMYEDQLGWFVKHQKIQQAIGGKDPSPADDVGEQVP